METTNNLNIENQAITVDIVETIEVGTEGPKYIADLYDDNSYRGRFFLKGVGNEKRARAHEEIHEHLIQSGIHTAEEAFLLEDQHTGGFWMALSDLTQNGRMWVYSMDAEQTRSSRYKEVVSRIPRRILRQIRDDLVEACELACIPILDGGNGDDVYMLPYKSFFITINPKRPKNTTYVVGDYGDMIKVGRENAPITIENNIISAAVFYTWMLGKKFEFPDKYKYLEEKMVSANDLDKILKYRGFPQSKRATFPWFSGTKNL